MHAHGWLDIQPYWWHKINKTECISSQHKVECKRCIYWNSWSTYREADREMWRSTAMVLPPGITAKRRLRAFKVYVLVHTWWIICHSTTTHRENIYDTKKLIFCYLLSVITCLIITLIATYHHGMCYTYTEEEREEAMLGLDLELVIWGYLILEYSLSFNLFLCKVTTWHESDSV